MAASFAEAGDFDAAGEMLAGDRKVLLVLTGREADAKSLKYALSIAGRTRAGLEVLAAGDSPLIRDVMGLCEREAGKRSISLKASRASGCIRESLIGYTRNRRDLVCVVIESTDVLDLECSGEQKQLEGIWRRLGCPLALVTEKMD